VAARAISDTAYYMYNTSTACQPQVMTPSADIPCCPPSNLTSTSRSSSKRCLRSRTHFIPRLLTFVALLAAVSPTTAFLVPAALTLSNYPTGGSTRGATLSDNVSNCLYLIESLSCRHSCSVLLCHPLCLAQLSRTSLLTDENVPSSPTVDEIRRSVWRPAVLPSLGPEQLAKLRAGEAVFTQQRTGKSGNGLAVFDLEGSPEAVWSLLTDYGRYDQVIGTVRKSTVRAGSTRACARATFVLSKFLLEVSVLHFFNPERSHLKFHLDPSSTNRILKEAEGMWFVETPASAPGLKPGHVRVWFRASVVVSRLVPSFVVDYAQSRALRRVTSWLKPAVDAAPLTLATTLRAAKAYSSTLEEEMTTMPEGWVVEG